MVNKRLLSLCDKSKKWIGMTVLMNWISIICNIAIVVYIGNVIDKLYNNDFNIKFSDDKRMNFFKYLIISIKIGVFSWANGFISMTFSKFKKR